MAVTITKYIEESTNGKIKDPSYATGWKRRVGTRMIEPRKGRKAAQYETLYEEAPAPRRMRYDDPGRDFKGGTITREIWADGPVDLHMDEAEVEVVVRALLTSRMLHLPMYGEPIKPEQEIARMRIIGLLTRIGVSLETALNP